MYYFSCISLNNVISYLFVGYKKAKPLTYVTIYFDESNPYLISYNYLKNKTF